MPVGRERVDLAKRRLGNILRTNVVANARTLENKISDSGPTNQRIDPHILTIARAELMRADEIRIYREGDGAPWYYLRGTPDEELRPRLAALKEVYDQTQDRLFTLRTGQALEIAVSKALQTQNAFQSVGHFRDLAAHDDRTLYRKEEPPSLVNGRSCEGKLDFLLFTPDAGIAGVEVKNIREWFYSDRDEVQELLAKCCALDAVPVLIVRRYAYEAYSVLTDCGVIIHQMYNQRYANADAALAERVKDKRLLGYHDVRVGNDPDERLTRFIHTNLPNLLPSARAKFDELHGLLEEYATEAIGHAEFVSRVRGRDKEPPEYDAGYGYEP
jgi:hypothetical protein